MMESIWERLWFRIWNFFTVNIGTKLVSVIVAIVLWAVVMGSRTVEATKEVPIEVTAPADLVPGNDLPDRISFRLSGPKALLSAILDRRYEPIRVNLTGAKAGLVTYRFFSDSIHVPIGVKVLSVNPTALLIKLEPLKRREVPVRLDVEGSPPEGYYLVGAHVEPPFARIKGSETRVDAVHEVVTQPIDLSELRKPFQGPAPLDLSRYSVQLDGPAPRMTIDVEAVGANFRIRDVRVHVLSSLKAQVTPPTLNVLVRTSPARMAQLDQSDIDATVDLRGKSSGNYVMPVKVDLPAGVSLVRVLPERVGVILR